MDKITFPIVEVDKNRLRGIDGAISYFFEITPIDLSQLTEKEIEQVFRDVGMFLNTIDENAFFKFYSLGGKAYVNSSVQDFNQLKFELGPSDRPLQTFFGSIDIFSDVSIFDDYLLYNGRYRRVLSVLEFGTDEIDHQFVPNGVDYILNIKRKSREKGIRGLEKIRSSHLANFFRPKRDVESEGAYHQAENLIQELMLGAESLFDIELFFVLTGQSLDELNSKTADLIDGMRSRGVKLFIEGQSIKKCKSGLAAMFRELIPGVVPTLLSRVHVDKTSHLKFLLPLNRSHLMDNGIAFEDNAGEQIFFDPFNASIPNKNMLVTGASGGGKSVFVNKLIFQLAKKHPTVILDKGGSFKRITLYHDGVNISAKFNPLQFRDPLYLREMVLSACDKEHFNKLERGRLLKSIRAIVEENPGPSNFFDFLKLLECDFPGISLYFEDVAEYLSDEKIAETPILYVDVADYPQAAIAPLIIFILEYFKNIKNPEKILVFDESWSFLKHHADYIDDCFRTFRKTGALPIAISQGLNDFAGIGGKLYSSITNNSFIKVFFPQECIDDPEVSEFDRKQIKSLRFQKGVCSECYVKSADNRFRKTMRLYLSPLELELFHTEVGEDNNFYKFYQEYRPFFDSNKETINSYVRLKYGEV
ncbi:MAG: hypothetical protein A2504_00360 [Bdellovibrionales bacterium RIFOXYD12_FULL_39_22]|nr:MAG: hypothetical protein A2385_13940 [Bdellovibrionales bacterium RIFOXYB1_FULL_39_21]OFZ42433.1 MAG: hypothetical protein A2485_03990 [Bdellovibrionales bacterium RIFOXYC12_FULL_39_17]OFZ45409.1 MAG: hypothetical protein A2404_01430 [Bdellovibrionales bacterium RIFOXYC1_FULL_39_130]OFZ68431.1 MAG: hypothetical protein A2451_01615 [Bdellovibrionales bacterium RIFOXYC2_FULL_39_8]OFZ74606.1 MAG: hypothetical protein A2560_09460 [Bdellovibrionales bacterium RIFOXYD1_FULL_39_84]OFZ92888.1 MAG: